MLSGILPLLGMGPEGGGGSHESMMMRRYKASKTGKWCRHEDVAPKLQAAQKLLALVEAITVDLDPEYGPDAELLAELPKLQTEIL